jgi:hypothetical protein
LLSQPWAKIERRAWIAYQSSRARDSIYKYLTAVFEIVSRWKKQNCAKTKSNQALAATKSTKAIRTNEPFAVIIWCTSDPHRVDAKTRNKHFDTPNDLNQTIRA